MEFQFKRDFNPEDGEVGKLILYHDKANNVIGANASSTKRLNLVQCYPTTQMLAVGLVRDFRIISEAVGFHKSIPHEGKILGGTLYARKADQLIVSGKSADFERINVGVLERCLADLNLTIFKGHLLDETPLDEFLGWLKK